jgi:hypothetical protein
MKGRQEQTAGACLDVDQAERRQGQAMVRLKVIKQTAFAAVAEDLIVEVKEDLQRNDFQLKGGLVVDMVSTGQGIAALSA